MFWCFGVCAGVCEVLGFGVCEFLVMAFGVDKWFPVLVFVL